MNIRLAIRTALLVCILVPMNGSRVAGPGHRPPADADEPESLYQLRRRGNELLRKGEYAQAASLYQVGLGEAKRLELGRPALRFLNNLGGAEHLMYRYRNAIQAYLQARQLATAAGDREALGALSFNLSSLYLQMGELEAAEQAASEGLQSAGGAPPKYRPKLLIQRALLASERGNREAALELFQQAIEEARLQEDAATEAQALNELGTALLEAGSTAGAEEAIVEALRIREENNLNDAHFSHEGLGRVRMKQGNFPAAIALFDRAIAAALKASMPVAMWSTYYERGRANLALSKLADAYGDLSTALKLARRWRASVLPADVFRISSNVELHEVHALFIQAGNRLYRQTGKNAYAYETFAAAEENRASSLRALFTDREAWTSGLPDEYWQVLSRLHAAEVELLNAETRENADAARKLRLILTEMEARAGVDLPIATEEHSGVRLLGRARAAMAADAVYLGFSLDAEHSYAYAITREAFEVYELPPEEEIAAFSRQFARAVADDSAEAPQLAHRLYRQLFGSINPHFLEKSDWILALDGELYEAPMAALVEGFRGGTPIYLIERHVLQMSPGVLSLGTARTDARLAGGFVGVGDPIYNRADSRWEGVRQGNKRSTLRMLAGRSRSGSGQLSRLAASGKEIESCSRNWRPSRTEPILLRGPDASKTRIKEALSQKPSVLHLATHVVIPEFEAGAGPAMIALSLNPSGEVDYLSATEIARMRIQVGLVVLNGCSSGTGAVLPGAGLMGLTRAWLAAGARAVIATRWPTPDHNGDLFQALYSSMNQPARANHSFAAALQRAQLAQLRSGGWRAKPGYWGAYFCIERN